MAKVKTSNELYISPSPHITGPETSQKIMFLVILSLIPLCIYGVYLFGLPALLTIGVAVVSCLVFEALFQVLTKQSILIKDGSAIVSGIMLALVLPPQLPLWMTVLGAAFAMIVAKAFFGGIGANVFNPALTGRAFLFVSFPAAMGTWPLPRTAQSLVETVTSATGGIIDEVTSATALSSSSLIVDSKTYFDFFIGNRAGCIGESSIALILLAFAFLAVTKVIDWRAPLAMVATVALASFLAGGDVLMAMLSGGLLFGAVFMATDYATSPVTKKGRLVFGFGAGLITFLIRQFGGYPEGVMFSILIMNALTPFLNKLIPQKYGYIKPSKKVAKK
ncbi:MAG TPA: RnfABCDGE type electron transport complex subunit D [Treponemataceae bacterium]|mgnify:FL=1|jgi:electron transport complex protein RnfD|nr:RnfABCDGE type electron transport complex subunit D [Treponemataceae bacterium]HOQ93076.1 RnfABCDGE type electron transport complex subunit D [Treponemataceae bacterium]HPM06493.1 RnfABCDGE type electron transport complex subunit D [Treponemataceae bacterium]HUH43680.1 RnfABCDGE type electron transport complex subunit D [Treponemataceae bacterium]